MHVVANYTDFIGSHIGGIFSKINRTFYKIGYRRAASELFRQGYHAEAKRCLELSNKL